MKQARIETNKEIIERILINLQDHQGCAMYIGLTQSLMKDCEVLLKRIEENNSIKNQDSIKEYTTYEDF